jgi:hypothetical protein
MPGENIIGGYPSEKQEGNQRPGNQAETTEVTQASPGYNGRRNGKGFVILTESGWLALYKRTCNN